MNGFFRVALIPIISLMVLTQGLGITKGIAGELGPRFDAQDVVGGNTSASSAQPGKQTKESKLPLDQIVAVVNNDVITQFELDERSDVLFNQFVRKSGQTPDKTALRRQVLERMITDKILVQYGRETGIRIDDATLDRALTRIAEGNKMDVPTFRSSLEKEGMVWPQFREEILSLIHI